ncbi:hypothetical protein MHY87_14440 [Microvirga sp. ACRRW]|uniref:hypothetical protein n=1 Tax=Microvirga sp. ACRRW TaxID=2918205 RepID=UPI001EF66F0B|nr:hypothetical protein [Microvirga sp. ACRRW]MCG7394106.1 hypothetical protein [Microvirga sp. ACRRW]
MPSTGMNTVLLGGTSPVGMRGHEMGWDDPFPIEKCSGRVRGAVLAEFQGRCPTVREVASISDAQWLTVPNIGPTTLEEIRRFINEAPVEQRLQNLPNMEDGELLSRLNRLQRELSLIASAVRTRISSASYKKEEQE